MGREILKELKKIKQSDIICYLDFICEHDSTGISGLQAAMIRVLANRMKFEDKQTLIAQHFSKVVEIQESVRPGDEDLIQLHFSAVTAAIKQARDAKEIDLGRRRNTIHRCKKQSWPSWFRFDHKARYDR